MERLGWWFGVIATGDWIEGKGEGESDDLELSRAGADFSAMGGLLSKMAANVVLRLDPGNDCLKYIAYIALLYLIE